MVGPALNATNITLESILYTLQPAHKDVIGIQIKGKHQIIEVKKASRDPKYVLNS